MVTLSSAENALKNVYLGVVSNQLNVNSNPLLGRIEQTSSDVWGNSIHKLAPFGLNGGIGAGTESGDLPTPYGNNYVKFVEELKNLYGIINISDKAIRSSANNAGAFVNLINAEMEGLIKASSFNLGRMLYGDGTGLLGSVVSISGAVATVDSVKNFTEGMVVDVYTTTVINNAGLRIQYVDRENKTITFSTVPAATITAADNIYVQGSKDNEITGLGKIFASSGSIYGLARASYPWLNAYANTDGGDIEDDMLQNAIDFLDEQSGSVVDFITCSSDVKRAYQKYLSTFRRNIDVTELAGGYKAITFNGIPVVSDRFVEDGTMYLLNTKEFHLHQLCDWKWLEGDCGNILHQQSGKAAYTATLVKYANLICDKPNGQAKITNISSTVTNPLTTIATATSELSADYKTVNEIVE